MSRLAILALALLLQACAMPRMLPAATDLQADRDEVVVIGKIELVPPLNQQLEQKTHWNVFGEKRMLDNIVIATGDTYKPVRRGQIDPAEFQSTLEAQWGKPFMVKMPRRGTWLNGGMTHLDVVQQDTLWFPGGLYFEVPQGAKAVYIGTLRYHRNDFNAITRVEIVEERKDIALVLKTGGAPAEVRSSLLKRLR